MGTRTLLVYIAKNINIDYLPILGYMAVIPALGFTYIYITGSRQTGAEVFGEKIWWNNLRPVHAVFYSLFAYNAIKRNKEAWIYLLYDLIFGLGSFLTHHYLVGSFLNLCAFEMRKVTGPFSLITAPFSSGKLAF
jgi:hypothetical protein